jgi:hypothetical protein
MVRITLSSWLRTALVVLAMIAAGAVGAENNSLYRHAFERWKPDIYQVMVFHHEPLSSESQQLVDALSAASGDTGANFTLAVLDVNQPMTEPAQTIWYNQTGVEPPWVVVSAPGADEATPPVWAGSLGVESVIVLLDSPVRRKIVEGLIGGDAAVWVLLECGDAVRDEAAVDLLAGELKRQQLKLASQPALTNLLAGSTQRLVTGGFSLVRVTRSNPAEDFLVASLLHGNLISHVKPAAFPIIGRGRALGALASRQLNAESIGALCELIRRDCTNEAKSSYPGKDILLAVNWEGRLNALASGAKELASAPGAISNAGATSLVSTSRPLATNLISDASDLSSNGASSSGGYARLGAFVFVVTAGLGFFILRSRRSGSS